MRYYVYSLKKPRQPQRTLVLDLQNNLLTGLKSRLVAPLQRKDTVDPREIIDGLMPVVLVEGLEYVLYTQEAAAYPVSGLGKVVSQIIRATPGVLDTVTCLQVD